MADRSEGDVGGARDGQHDGRREHRKHDGKPQLLHLVFGGALETIGSTRFADPGALDIVGIYPDYKSAYDAWKEAAQKTVDDAHMRYFIVHLHRLLDPTSDDRSPSGPGVEAGVQEGGGKPAHK